MADPVFLFRVQTFFNYRVNPTTLHGRFFYASFPLFHVRLIGRKSGSLRWPRPCRLLFREMFFFKRKTGGGGRAGVASPGLSPIHFNFQT
jgi:hypothetical protein